MDFEHPIVDPEDCECYKCAETEYLDDGTVANNMEYHTYGQECKVCSKERTEYKDLGRKGRYVCPDQTEHSAEEYQNA